MKTQSDIVYTMFRQQVDNGHIREIDKQDYLEEITIISQCSNADDLGRAVIRLGSRYDGGYRQFIIDYIETIGHNPLIHFGKLEKTQRIITTFKAVGEGGVLIENDYPDSVSNVVSSDETREFNELFKKSVKVDDIQYSIRSGDGVTITFDTEAYGVYTIHYFTLLHALIKLFSE